MHGQSKLSPAGVNMLKMLDSLRHGKSVDNPRTDYRDT
jgi:hypothetical protein